MPSVTVLGSVNVDLVAHCDHLPRLGETIPATAFDRFPGGKGGNQALAARRAGADTRLVAAVGSDTEATLALRRLESEGVDLSSVVVVDEEPTGVALITVDTAGENHIVVVPGANSALTPAAVDVSLDEAVLCQFEIPGVVLEAAASTVTGMFCVNAAPAIEVPGKVFERADLVIVNESERDALSKVIESAGALVVVTMGAAGAKAYRSGRLVAEAQPPPVTVVDTVGAGDAFCGALVTSLMGGSSVAAALRWACAAGALATTKLGAQEAAPTAAAIDEVLAP